MHKCSSLACAIFLLMTCITGLPLIFSQEIAHWLDDGPTYAAMPQDTPRLSLDSFVSEARKRYPGQIITSVFSDVDEPKVIVAMACLGNGAKIDPRTRHWLKFDARTGELLQQSKPAVQRQKEQPLVGRLMDIMFRLHSDLYARLPGQLFLGLMAFLFVVAIVSGLLLYNPYMKKLDFGTVRAHRSKRLKWLDLHNLLGAVTLAWALVVGATGVCNELAGPLFRVWMATDVQAALVPWHDAAVPVQAQMSSVQGAYDVVRAALPGTVVESMTFPNSQFGSPYHYLLWTKGDSPLTSRLFNAALVDARTGKLSALLNMPWYLRVLQLSRPLHFGDYGGLPLKIIWAVLDLLTIIVLGSGLYLWFVRRRQIKERLEKLVAAHGDRLLSKASS